MMTENRDDTDGNLSAEATEALLRLLVTGDSRRVSSAEIDGQTVWIKRYDAEPRMPFKRLHALTSRLAPLPFLRSSRPVGPEGQVAREIRKMRAFAGAGFAVPKILFHNERALVLSDAAMIVQRELSRLKRDGAADMHDRLLVGAAEALGLAHRAGLCHGRPHPRDMFGANGEPGFIDFEEEPEAVMPLEIAQARDVWLLFLQICTQAMKKKTQNEALSAYFAAAPEGIAVELRRIIRFFSPLLPVLRVLKPVGLGKDGQRVLKATEFLRTALAVNPATLDGLAGSSSHPVAGAGKRMDGKG